MPTKHFHMKNLHPTGLKSTIAAFVGNFIITIFKFVGFFVSGSGAMFSEAIHSLADSSNQALLIVGIKRSLKIADEEHSYGYGQERFFWALISACGIFFIGAGVTVYHGIVALVGNVSIEISSVVYWILGVSLLVEGTTLLFALKELRSANTSLSLSEALVDGDPSTLAVIYEDSVAVLGVIVALISTLLTSLTNNHNYDSIGSIIIGVLLGIIAIVLIVKNRSYLIQKSMPEEMKERAIEIIEANPAIEKVIDFKSSVLDVGVYRIKCEVEFNGSALIKKMFGAGDFKEQYEEIKDDYEEFLYFCVDYADRVPRVIGEQINEIEKKIKEEVPGIKHIDIEIN